jgi:hypothetical protein
MARISLGVLDIGSILTTVITFCLPVPAHAQDLPAQEYIRLGGRVVAIENTGTVATPTFSPSAGTYSSSQTITISVTTSGASIRYTTDGATPTPTYGTPYSGPITVSSNQTVKAIAYETGWNPSSVASAGYTIIPGVATPTFSPPPGTYSFPQTVSLGTTTSGAFIRYTTDGTTPTSSSGYVYSGGINVEVSEAIKAIAYKSGWNDSTVATGIYDFVAATPGFSPAGGSYTSPQTVTISTGSPGASIRYTTDGSIPTSSFGTVYSGPVNVAASETIKAIAYRSGWADSAIASASYTLPSGTVATPTFSIASGTYYGVRTVNIGTTTSGATIRYTTDGSTPSSTNGIVGTSVTISSSTTLKAIAYKTGMYDSSVASVSITIVYPSANLNISRTSFQTGDSFSLWLYTNIPNTSFTFCWYNGTQWCQSNFGQTDANGYWPMTGDFPPGTEGAWQEWVVFPGIVTSNTISFTVSPPPPTATLSISGTSFKVGDNFYLSLTTNMPNTSFTFCWAVGLFSQTCTENYAQTDAYGNWPLSGSFLAGSEGTWQEWVVFPQVTSNHIYFTVE